MLLLRRIPRFTGEPKLNTVCLCRKPLFGVLCEDFEGSLLYFKPKRGERDEKNETVCV